MMTFLYGKKKVMFQTTNQKLSNHPILQHSMTMGFEGAKTSAEGERTASWSYKMFVGIGIKKK